MTLRPEQETIEAQLRAAAPTLPPELRQRVLNRCQERPRKRLANAWVGRWHLAGALAGVVFLCWIASVRLDAQSQAMIAGTQGQESRNSVAVRASILKPMDADNQNFSIALRWRIRQLALLLHDKHSG